ncbi:uncharacterized protein LOC128884069 [Hylaeus volcanicus]|uniref:uncharacterized protein LOC128884069 n=1 Tax=Hylaeus volcanicus TaxID=313075 RepID=UPI0023B79C1B|nr:uncharacterized protein LOC128884069 [Hylaeus volcanicus]
MLKISHYCFPIVQRHCCSIYLKVHHFKHYTTQQSIINRSNSEFQNLHISQLNRDDLFNVCKDIFKTVQFWTQHIKNKDETCVTPSWLPRDSNTIQVEKSVFITKKNLLNLMWENGFQPEEMALFENTFPHNYEFHAPELALLFNCSLEDSYKYCLNTQTKDSRETLLVNQKKNSPRLKLGLYGLLSSFVWFGTQTTILGNAWMMTKTWPFFAVLYMLALRFKGSIMNMLNDSTLKEEGIAQKNKTDGEEVLYRQIQKLKGEEQLLQQVNQICDDTEKICQEYQKALVAKYLKTMTWSMTRHLHAIRRDQKSLFVTVQKSIVENIIEAFSNEILEDKKLYQSLLEQSIQAITTKENPLETILKKHLNEKLKDIQNNNFHQTFLRRIQDNFQKEYHTFLEKYTVKQEESDLLKQLANQALVSRKPIQLNLNRLSKEDYQTVLKLRASILERLGLQYSVTYDFLDNDLNASNPVIQDLTTTAQDSMQQWQSLLEKKTLRNFLLSFL